MCVSVVPVCLCTMCMQYPQGPEEGIEFLGTRVTGGREPPMWVLGSECQVLCKSSLHSVSEPSLQSPHLIVIQACGGKSHSLSFIDKVLDIPDVKSSVYSHVKVRLASGFCSTAPSVRNRLGPVSSSFSPCLPLLESLDRFSHLVEIVSYFSYAECPKLADLQTPQQCPPPISL